MSMNGSLPGGLSRSQSFASLIVPRRQVSATNSRPDSSVISSKRSSWFGSSTLSSPQLGSTLSLNNNKQQQKLTAIKGGLKEPRPQRTVIVAAAISQGIREAIATTEGDIDTLKNSLSHLTIQSQQSQGRTYDLEKQLKLAERYLKRLDYQLSTLEELQETYHVQSRLREGVRAMGKAYIESLGRERDSALANVRSGFKECNQVMCSLENQLESLMGALNIEMKGLQGFARLCPGDVFEITLRHGSQKWRTRGKIGRDGSQSWETPKFVLRPVLDELLFIRAIEIRTLGKQVLLGNKYCETLDLYSAQPQMMTVNLNTSGSLKLNLAVTWDPLYGALDESGVNSAKAGGGGSNTLQRQASGIHSFQASPVGTISSMAAGSVAALSMGSYGSEGSPDHDSGQSSTLNSTSPLELDFLPQSQVRRRGRERADDPPADYSSRSSSAGSHAPMDHHDDEEEEDAHDQILATAVIHHDSVATPGPPKSDSTGNFLLVRRSDAGSGGNWWQQRYYSSPTRTVDSGYDEMAKRHMPSLENVFTEEDEEDAQVGDPDKDHHASDDDDDGRDSWSPQPLMSTDDKGAAAPATFFGHKDHLHAGSASPEQARNWSRAADRDLVSVLDALTNVIDDIQGLYPQLEQFEHSVASLDQLTKDRLETSGGPSGSVGNLTVDNVLECFDFLDNEESGSLNDLTAGSQVSSHRVVFNGQLDKNLLAHLMYSRYLVESLGAFGPLKCREKESLDKLQVQGRILSKLVKLIDKWNKHEHFNFSSIAELNGLPHLQKLWSTACPSQQLLAVASKDAYQRLLPLARTALPCSSSETQERALQMLIARCHDLDEYDGDLDLTVFQFRYFVRSKERSFQSRLEEIRDELELTDSIFSGNLQVLERTVRRLSLFGPLPGTAILIKMSRLLIDPCDRADNPRILIASYFRNTSQEQDLRQKLLAAFVQGLESADVQDRLGSCHALSVLEARTAVDQLAYLGQSDPSLQVRQQAKHCLLALGSEGIDALEQLQLSSHGFQGISVK